MITWSLAQSVSSVFVRPTSFVITQAAHRSLQVWGSTLFRAEKCSVGRYALIFLYSLTITPVWPWMKPLGLLCRCHWEKSRKEPKRSFFTLQTAMVNKTISLNTANYTMSLQERKKCFLFWWSVLPNKNKLLCLFFPGQHQMIHSRVPVCGPAITAYARFHILIR